MVAEKIIEAVSQPCEVSVNNVAISPTIRPSIGIALFPKDGTSPDALVKNADQAMYRAKRKGTGYAFAR